MGQPTTIAAPGDLRIPDRMDEVMASLNDAGAREFIDEMTKALSEAQDANDLTPVQYVVNAWWVSSLFCTHDGIEKALDAAELFEGDRLTAEQVGELLGVA